MSEPTFRPPPSRWRERRRDQFARGGKVTAPQQGRAAGKAIGGFCDADGLGPFRGRNVGSSPPLARRGAFRTPGASRVPRQFTASKRRQRAAAAAQRRLERRRPPSATELPPIAVKADDLEAIEKAVDDAAAVGEGLWFSYLVRALLSRGRRGRGDEQGPFLREPGQAAVPRHRTAARRLLRMGVGVTVTRCASLQLVGWRKTKMMCSN